MNLLVLINSGAICASSFRILMISYIVILHSLWNHSAEGRKKALSICTSWSVYIYIYSAPSHIPHEQDGGSIVHDWNTLPQSTHLHTEEYRSEKCHEKVKTCQNYLKKQKMNCGAGMTVYWVMVLVNLYKLSYMTMFDSCGSSIIKIKVCFALLLLLLFLIHRQDECQGFSFFHGPNVPILIMIPCQSLFFNWFSSVKSLSCVQLCNPIDCKTPGFPVHHQQSKNNMKGFFVCLFVLFFIYLYLLGHCEVWCLNWCLRSFMWCVKRPICIKENRSAIILLQAHLV